MSTGPWIGLSALHSPTVYRWVTGQTLVWGYWFLNLSPASQGMFPLYCVYAIGGALFQNDCLTPQQYVCQDRPPLGK